MQSHLLGVSYIQQIMSLVWSFWFLLIITSVTTHYAILSTSAEKAFVRPSENMSCLSQPQCLTLNDYASEPNHYFVDNTTFLVLPGIHQLDIQLHLENVSDISFQLVNDEVQDDTVKVFLGPLVNIT